MEELNETKFLKGKLTELQHDKKVLTTAIVVIISLIVFNYIWNNRGGIFMVRACNDDTFKCYTLRAKLNAGWRATEGTLYFSNGGSLHFDCSENFGCADTEDTPWTINKINRL